MASLFKAGDSKEFNYTGNIQSIELLPGRYKLECYGASGGIGNGNINPIGKGGYASGELFIPTLMTLYVHVGQDGINNWATSVRYNGGGAAINVGGHNGGAGGGATDFRLSSAAWNNVESLKTRILVAGGGGGAQSNCGNTATAGHGGNLTGGTSYNQGYQGRPVATAAARAYSKGGTQTSGGIAYNVNDNNNSSIASGSFGSGANSVQCGAGGGGGWYGGASGYTSGGGGGSSYAAGYPGCDTTYHNNQNNIVLENVVFTQGINTGNGYAIITAITIKDPKTLTLINADRVTQTLAKYPTETVNISVDTSKNAVRFKEWKVEGATVSDKKLKTISFIMPDNDVNVEALLYDLYNLMVINSDGVLQELQAYETEKVDISLGQYNAWNVFEYWYIKNVEIEDIYSQDITFKMPANDVYVEAVFGPNRLNTNIYKNIFPEDVFDYGRIMTLQETAPTTLQDITQENHGFIVGNIVSCVNGKYQKAIADNTEQGIPLGIVAAVHNENVFTLLSTGIFNWKQYNYEDTSVLYLSDTIPGTLVHYSQIKTNIYVPVAVYINNNQILLNLQDKTVGAPMAPYEQYSQNFDTYDKTELDEIVQHAISGVI